MTDKPKRIWGVTLPIAGHAYLTVEADSEEEAIERAFMEVEVSDIEDWGALKQFTEGNVCYCPHPWEAEAVDETPDETTP